MEPGRAFDAISKVLFIKMYIERTGKWGTFTTEYLDKRAAVRLPTDPPVHEQLFEQTKKHYTADEIFSERDALEISEETFRRLVEELARFNLSATSDDVKGLAFERFLGDTFRGELGQFFTPRPIVDFMVDLLDPKERELICDPAAGSGGFLIRVFEHIRKKITDDVQARKDQARDEIEAKNMIMHGDGHGGIHYHDGLVDINGVFPGRFNIVLTNPPFGQNVGDDQKFGSSEQTRIPKETAYEKHCRERYGDAWRESHAHTVGMAEAKAKILDNFEIGKDKPNRPTEILFLERCLQLLRPGGRMGIVLPDGNLNNPSLSWLRRWAEGKARLLAVVSLPEETFVSAEATVKASLVFLRKFTQADQEAWETAWRTAHEKHDPSFTAERSRLCAEYGPRIASADTPALTAILRGLETLGLRRQLPDWKQADPPAYPRGVGMTGVGKAHWVGESLDKKRVRELRKQFEDAWNEEADRKADTLHRELRAKLRRVDAAHNAALWREVREIFDYPVFTAAPDEMSDL